ncbi:MAG: hypothetical protein KBC69_01975 [Candidatus Magasanikbacteria bacterium]|nr:hypothetical protein [Candidatus Magasanikbacteria bacterium]
MSKEKRGEVMFVSPELESKERLKEVADLIKNGWPDDYELQPQEVLLAEQAVDFFRNGRMGEGGMERRLTALNPQQLTRVVRRFVLSSFGLGKERFAEGLNEYETNEKEKNFNYALIAILFLQKNKVDEAWRTANKIVEPGLQELVRTTIEKNTIKTN